MDGWAGPGAKVERGPAQAQELLAIHARIIACLPMFPAPIHGFVCISMAIIYPGALDHAGGLVQSSTMNFPEMTAAGAKLAPLIDHTILKPETTGEQVVQICREARHYGFAAVCASPVMLPVVVRELKGSPVKPCTVVGFPSGANTPASKSFEAAEAARNGAEELDMVMAVGMLKARNYTHVLDDIRGVVKAADGRTVKVILETCLLTDEEKTAACRIVVEAGAHFVKTATGFAGGGATVEDIKLMRRIVGPAFGVKASGLIKTAADAQAMVAAGANRIGTSSGVAIVTALPQ